MAGIGRFFWSTTDLLSSCHCYVTWCVLVDWVDRGMYLYKFMGYIHESYEQASIKMRICSSLCTNYWGATTKKEFRLRGVESHVVHLHKSLERKANLDLSQLHTSTQLDWVAQSCPWWFGWLGCSIKNWTNLSMSGHIIVLLACTGQTKSVCGTVHTLTGLYKWVWLQLLFTSKVKTRAFHYGSHCVMLNHRNCTLHTV